MLTEASQNIKPLLKAINITWTNNKGFTLGPINLTVQKGEKISILGPSGSGKSTLLRILSGNQIPTSGTIEWDGIERKAEDLLIAGFNNTKLVDQNLDIPYKQTLNSLFVKEKRKSPHLMNKKATEELIEQFDFNHSIYKTVEELSTGEKQRLSICLALISQTNNLFLDEALSHQDAWRRQNLLEQIYKYYANSEKNLFLSTHLIDEAQYLGNRIIYLQSGKLIFDGTYKDLKDIKRSDIQSLLGWISPINDQYIKAFRSFSKLDIFGVVEKVIELDSIYICITKFGDRIIYVYSHLIPDVGDIIYFKFNF